MHAILEVGSVQAASMQPMCPQAPAVIDAKKVGCQVEAENGAPGQKQHPTAAVNDAYFSSPVIHR